MDLDRRKPNKYDYHNCIEDAMRDGGCDDLDITAVDIKSITDIPFSWRDAIPFGDRDGDMTCEEIFNANMVPKKHDPYANDPNQMKMEFK